MFEQGTEESKLFEMPASWVTQIHISEKGDFCMTYNNPSTRSQSCRAYCWMQWPPDLWCSLFAFKDMESRFPGGSKVIRYRKATLEKFSPYHLEDGLVTRLTTFDDLDCEFKLKFFMNKKLHSSFSSILFLWFCAW